MPHKLLNPLLLPRTQSLYYPETRSLPFPPFGMENSISTFGALPAPIKELIVLLAPPLLAPPC